MKKPQQAAFLKAFVGPRLDVRFQKMDTPSNDGRARCGAGAQQVLVTNLLALELMIDAIQAAAGIRPKGLVLPDNAVRHLRVKLHRFVDAGVPFTNICKMLWTNLGIEISEAQLVEILYE